ncbi:MAG TPA: hypothetical protein ENN38_01855 [Actinobacteria bacterium]|nr:hypothetical protein [Actinomycetota bacterium]
MKKDPWKEILDYLLKKLKSREISESELKQLKFCIHIDELLEYLKIADRYLENSLEIQEKVEQIYPFWTGYENEYLIYYHYDAFANFLYAYKEAWANFLRELYFINKASNLKDVANSNQIKLVKQKTKSGQTMKGLIVSFLDDSLIKKVESDRTDTVHIYGENTLNCEETRTQNWGDLIKKTRKTMQSATNVLLTFNSEMSQLICKEIVSKK